MVVDPKPQPYVMWASGSQSGVGFVEFIEFICKRGCCYHRRHSVITVKHAMRSNVTYRHRTQAGVERQRRTLPMYSESNSLRQRSLPSLISGQLYQHSQPSSPIHPAIRTHKSRCIRQQLHWLFTLCTHRSSQRRSQSGGFSGQGLDRVVVAYTQNGVCEHCPENTFEV